MRKKLSFRRKSAGIVAIVLAIAILTGSTFAWQSISQHAINNANGTVIPAGARLHNDFMADQNWLAGANQDIYVENYSGTNPSNSDDKGQPVFVRAKLAEYMEIGTGAGKFTYTGVADPMDYQELDQAGACGARTADANNNAVPVVAGASITDISSWTTHIQGDATNQFAVYWDWTMGGSKVFMPTFNKDNTSLLTDRTENNQDQYITGEKITDNAAYSVASYDSQSEEHTAKSSLTTADVVTMQEWKDMGSPLADTTGNGYWVGDADGWFYWSKALMSGEATGLLLDGIKLNAEPDMDWYYAVHVTSQMATAGDWGDSAANTGFYETGLTDDGLELLNKAAAVLIIPTDTPIGGEFTDNKGVVWAVLAEENGHKLITTKYVYGNGTTFSEPGIWNPLDEGPNHIKPALRDFYSNTAGTDVKNVAVPYVSPLPDVRSALGGSYEETINENAPAGYSHPNGTGTAETDGGNAIFILSISEVNQYLDTSESRIAQDVSSTDNSRSWWLRSPGSDSMAPTTSVSPYGYIEIHSSHVTYCGFRPCLWIKTNNTPAPSDPIKDTDIHDSFLDDNGVVWTVLAKESGHKLIITEYVYGYPTTQYNTSNTWNHLDTPGNNLKSILQNFYSNTVGTNIKNAAVAYVSLPDVRSVSDESFNYDENSAEGYSHPNGTVTATANGSNAAFVLSISEVNQYMPAKTGYDGSSGIPRSWWLRSPGYTSAYPASFVNNLGQVRSMAADYGYLGFRLALWVKS